MDAERALADLLELSRDVETVAVLDGDWRVTASNVDTDVASAFAEAVAELVRDAERVKPGPDARLTQLRAVTDAGALFVVRESERAVAAVAARSAPPALVLHDLGACLRELVGAPREETADARA